MDELVTSIFNKELNQIQISDVKNFFSEPQEETSVLEFKTGDVNFESIIKEVCAFCNTSGGLLIIGSPLKKLLKSKEIYQGELIPTKEIKNKMILSQKISSQIIPAPVGIKIQELDDTNGKIYVLVVPQSYYPPHQASFDGKYYIRLETETRFAPHGLIQALFFQRQNPSLKAEYYIEQDQSELLDTITVHFSNDSEVCAEEIGYIVEFYGVKNVTEVRDIDSVSQENVTINLKQRPFKQIAKGFHFTKNENNLGNLLKGLLIPLDFKVFHYFNNYLVNLSFWCKNGRVKNSTLVINPRKKQDEMFIYKSDGEIEEDVETLLSKFEVYKPKDE